MKQHYILGLILLLFVTSCSKDYFIADQFKQKTAHHQTIAILPFEVVTTGNLPEDLSDEDLRNIQNAESRAFQISLFNEVLNSTQSGSKPLRVDVQSADLTHSLLSEGIMDYSEINQRDPELLASMLDVDAVVMSRVEKTRYMSDLASFGIQLGTRIIELFGGNARGLFYDGKTEDIKLSTQLIEPNNGTVLWTFNHTGSADYSIPSTD